MDFGVSINPMKLCAKFMFVYLFLRNWAVMSYPRGPWPKRGNVHWSGMWLGTSVGDAMGLGSGPASLSGPPPCPACAINSGEYPSLMTLCLSFLFLLGEACAVPRTPDFSLLWVAVDEEHLRDRQDCVKLSGPFNVA